MFTNAQKRNWTLFLWSLSDFLQLLPLQSSEEEIQAILWHPLGLLKLMKRSLLHPIHCCWRRKQYHCETNWPKHFKIDYIYTFMQSDSIFIIYCTTLKLPHNICHFSEHFHTYKIPFHCQVLLNNKISSVYAETNRNIQPPLKKNCIYTRHGRINWKFNVWKTNIQKAWNWQNYLLPKNKKNPQNYQNVWYLRKMKGALT